MSFQPQEKRDSLGVDYNAGLASRKKHLIPFKPTFASGGEIASEARKLKRN